MKTASLLFKSREFLGIVMKVGFIASLAFFTAISASAADAHDSSLRPSRSIPVAFVISEGAVVIDFCGPWEVFRDVMTGNAHPFHLYTVSDKTAPIRAGGGMKIVPDYTFANAPAPKVIVIPAQSQPSPAVLDPAIVAERGRDDVCVHRRVRAREDRAIGWQERDHISCGVQ